MQDIYDVIENVNNIYDSNSAFEVLKDFERVIDELDIYAVSYTHLTLPTILLV